MQAQIIPSIKKRILVVEDHEADRYILKRLLGNSYEIDFAVSPHQALLRLTNQIYDVILLDLELADSVNGLELAAYLRARTRNNLRPVIAMSSFLDRFSRDSALQAGCNDFLAKPLERSLLLEAIEKHWR